MGDLSVPLLGLCVTAGGAGVHALLLWLTVRREQPATERAARGLAEATPGAGDVWVWRSIPDSCRDPKLVLGYERECQHQVLQYPTLQPGAHVRFSGGRVRLMTDSALQQILAADDSLRDKLGLEPADGSAAGG